MKIKKILSLCVPPIFNKVVHHFLKPKYVYPVLIQKPETMEERLVILGNGPSLRETLQKHLKKLIHMECMAVNFFAMTEYYELLAPAFYVLNDNAFFEDEQKLKLTVENLIERIVEKTQWKMTMVIPNCYCNAEIVFRLKANKNINFIFWDVINHSRKGLSMYEAWDKCMLVPPQANVLNFGVWLAIYWGYPETYIVGADTSWMYELMVDQENNRLYTMDKHFYSKESVYKDSNLYNVEGEKRYLPNSLHYELSYITASFGAYEELQKYADWKGVKLYNASEYSLIDSIKRKKLSTI